MYRNDLVGFQQRRMRDFELTFARILGLFEGCAQVLPGQLGHGHGGLSLGVLTTFDCFFFGDTSSTISQLFRLFYFSSFLYRHETVNVIPITSYVISCSGNDQNNFKLLRDRCRESSLWCIGPPLRATVTLFASQHRSNPGAKNQPAKSTWAIFSLDARLHVRNCRR